MGVRPRRTGVIQWEDGSTKVPDRRMGFNPCLRQTPRTFDKQAPPCPGPVACPLSGNVDICAILFVCVFQSLSPCTFLNLLVSLTKQFVGVEKMGDL